MEKKMNVSCLVTQQRLTDAGMRALNVVLLACSTRPGCSRSWTITTGRSSWLRTMWAQSNSKTFAGYFLGTVLTQQPQVCKTVVFHMDETVLQGLREHSVVLMGKNTMMKRCIKVYAEEKEDDKWNVLLDYLVGNVGIIFTTVSFASTSKMSLFCFV